MEPFVDTLAHAHAATPDRVAVEGLDFQNMVARSAHAVVYSARDSELALPVAVKEYLPLALAEHGPGGVVARDAAGFERGLEAFVEESRALAHCNHRGVLRVLRQFHARGTVYRVMPWVEAGTLLQVRRAMNSPPAEDAVRGLVGEVLEALVAWQRVAPAYGGVAPDQVLLDAEDNVLLPGPGAAGRVLLEVGARVEPAQDLRAVAALARFALDGVWPPLPDAEPLVVALQRLYGAAVRGRYDEAWLRAIDAAAGPQPMLRSLRQAREALVDRPAAVSAAGFRGVAAEVPLAAPAPEPGPEHDALRAFDRAAPWRVSEPRRRRAPWRLLGATAVLAAAAVAGWFALPFVQPLVPGVLERARDVWRAAQGEPPAAAPAPAAVPAPVPAPADGAASAPLEPAPAAAASEPAG